MPLAFHDGEFVEKSGITVNAADYGFARGVAIFELARVYGGKPFRLDDHLDRFEQGARAYGVRIPLPRGEIKTAIKTVIVQNAYPHSVLKLYLTAGECGKPGIAFGDSDQFTSHLMIMEDEMHPRHPEAPKGFELYRRGIGLKSVPFSRQLPLYKTTNYAPGFQAARQAAAEGWDEIIFTHADGYLTETTTSNFFAVIDGMLCTPARGMLHGVTRKVLLELAPEIGLAVTERDLALADLAHAAEAFITGSYVEMLPVKKIDHVVFPVTMGPVFMKLRQALSAYIKAAV